MSAMFADSQLDPPPAAALGRLRARLLAAARHAGAAPPARILDGGWRYLADLADAAGIPLHRAWYVVFKFSTRDWEMGHAWPVLERPRAAAPPLHRGPAA